MLARCRSASRRSSVAARSTRTAIVVPSPRRALSAGPLRRALGKPEVEIRSLLQLVPNNRQNSRKRLRVSLALHGCLENPPRRGYLPAVSGPPARTRGGGYSAAPE